MKRAPFPSAPRPPSPPREGALFFEGPYECAHCGGAHAQWGRFSMAPQSNLSFCCPECAAAYNAYMPANSGIRERHAFIESQCKRRVPLAPPRRLIKGMERHVWLYEIRNRLTDEELKMTAQEMVVKLKREQRKFF